MLRKPQCLAADDVTIRCRVRHSAQASSNREFTEPQEMICTMRVWHKTAVPNDDTVIVRKIGMARSRSFESAHLSRHQKQQQRENSGPELVLTPIESPVMDHACCSSEFTDPITMSERFASFGSGSADKKGGAGGGPQHRSSSRTRSRPRTRRSSTPLGGAPTSSLTMRTMSPKALSNVTFPISDIMLVDMFGRGRSHQCNLTTLSSGYFEFTMENRNGQDILLAFLTANLPKERVMETLMSRHRTGSELSSRTGQSERSGKSFDVEAFTAKRMSERVSNETISEKLRRKVVRVFSSFEEISAVLTECACGCSRDSISPAPLSQTERRDSPPPHNHLQYDFDHLETAPDKTPERTKRFVLQDYDRSPEEAYRRRQMLKECNLPSGLSVEADEGPELETTAY